jgi:hypothetical protein
MPSALQKITTRAKQLRKKSPGKKWATCVKEASREYRGGKKISGTKKRGGKKKAAVSRPAGRRITGVPGDGVSLSQSLAQTKRKLTEELGWALATQRSARTKTDKKRLAPKIAELTKKLKALC